MKPIIILITASILSISATTIPRSIELPMKNGLVFYEFADSFQNTKKCIAKYISDQMAMSNVIYKIHEFVAQQDGVFKKHVFAFVINGTCGSVNDIIDGKSTTCQCKDTTGTSMWTLEIPNNLDFTDLYPSYIHIAHKKVTSQKLTAFLEIILVNKTTIKVRLKGFTYHVFYTKGLKAFSEEIPLGTLYSEYRMAPDGKSGQLFETIDKLCQATNSIIVETVSEAYRVDEL